jgi:tetratricopeptide (TPR) repeat protein
MKVVYSIILSLLFLQAYCQNFDEVKRLYQKRKFEELIQYYQQYRYIDSFPVVDAMVGNAYYNIEKYDSCVLYLNLAIFKYGKTAPTECYINLALAYTFEGKNKEGKAEIDRLIDLGRFGKEWQTLFNERLGMMYLNEKKTDSAIQYLEKCPNIDKPIYFKYVYYYLSRAYILEGKTDTAIKMLVALDSTIYYPFNKFAKILFDSINAKEKYKYSSFYPTDPHWVMCEGTNILYFFEDTNGWTLHSVDKYIEEHERAYNILDSIFHYQHVVPLSSKITFYVFNTGSKSFDKTGMTDVFASICYVSPEQSVGHELAHALSNWGWGYRSINVSRLINEGIAVAFNMKGDNKLISARNAAIGYNHIHTVLDLWNYFPSGSGHVAIINNVDFYALAGGFISYLYNHSSFDQFKELIKNQSRENAERIYGKDKFTQLIDDFNDKMAFN